jgi:uncharacterized membrane protein
MILLTVMGIGVAGYLTYVHYAGIKPACTAGGGCEKVQTSTYSALVGIPVALLGLLAYLSILALLMARASESTRFATVGITTVGFGFSAYLTYRELFSIHAICDWCVSSAVILTVLMCLAIWQFLQGSEHPAGDTLGTGHGSSDNHAAHLGVVLTPRPERDLHSEA